MTLAAMVSWVVLGALALVPAEMFARRVVRRGGHYVWRRFYRRTMPLDPALSAHLEPEATFNVNADGERGSDCPRREDLFRILVAGGSTVECAALDQATSWTARMQDRLNDPTALQRLGVGYVHVGNVGKSGLDATAVREVIERTPPSEARFHAVVLMIGAGDLLRWLERGAPADPRIDPVTLEEIFDESANLSHGLQPRRLALAELLRRGRMRFQRPIDRRVRASRWMTRARRMRLAASRTIVDTPDARRFLDRFEANADAAVAAAVARTDRVFIMRHPRFQKERYTEAEDATFWEGGVGNSYRGDAITTYFSTPVIFGLFEEIDERMRKIARKRGLPFIDPQPLVPMSVESFFDRFHLTPKGAEVVGKVIADAILATDVAAEAPRVPSAENGRSARPLQVR